MSLRRSLSVILALGLVAVACSSSDDAAEAPADDTSAVATPSAVAGGDGEASAACDPAALPLFADGVLTVATGEPVFEPWMVDDDPTNGQGFESALVYALSEQMGLDTVEWARVGFDQSIAPGAKDYDFNIQQFSITPDRQEAVDFSMGYYAVEQALIAPAGSSVSDATTLADLTDDRLGAAIGTTSLDYIDMAIQPDAPAQVYDDNAAAKAAFSAGQIDGLVLDLPTAYFVTAVEIPEASIVGILPRVGEDPEKLGMLFEKGSELVPCVDAALQALVDDGTLEALEEEWLSQGGDIPTLTQ